MRYLDYLKRFTYTPNEFYDHLKGLEDAAGGDLELVVLPAMTGTPATGPALEPTVTETGIYTTYIFGAGAFGWGEGGAPVPTETARDALSGDDILVNRRHFILHPRGVAFRGAQLGDDNGGTNATPSNANLADHRNWIRVYEAKNVRIVQFKHKLA